MDIGIHTCFEAPVVADGFAGDDERGIALRDYLGANYDRLHRRLLRHLGCPDQASDCLHDAWLRLGETTVSAAVHSPEAYVYRVCCNLAMDRLRSNRPWQHTDDELEHIADQAPSPECIAEARSDLAAVARAMQCLPPRHQAILVALRIDELTRDEVASRYGLSLRRVDTALRQALDHCAGQTGQPVTAGVRSPRRALRQRQPAHA